MKSARAGDIWRKALQSRKGRIKLESIVTENVKGIGDKTIVFPERFTALCGENGAGKTTLLRTVYASLAPRSAEANGIVLKPQSEAAPAIAKASVTARRDEGGRSVTAPVVDSNALHALVQDDTDSCLVVYLDSAAMSQRIRYVINNDHDFATALEGMPQADDSAETLQLRRNITGRSYSSFVTYEIEEYGEESTFPYFTATVGGVTYGSEEMGLGELCVNYSIWALGRVLEDSIVLLEEPEAHLPPRAQEALMNYVAQLAVDKSLNVIVSTHSQHTLMHVPSTHVSLLARNIERFVFQQGPRPSVLYESLRIVTSKTCLVVAEDHAAAAYLETLLAEYAPASLERVDITWGSGWSDIDAILSRLRNEYVNYLTVIGAYDGDQRTSQRPQLFWPYVYLPGDGDPAEYMVAAVKHNVGRFAQLLNRAPEELEVACANLSTTNVKDYFHQLKRALGHGANIHQLYAAATRLWLVTEEGNQKASSGLCAEIRDLAF